MTMLAGSQVKMIYKTKMGQAAGKQWGGGEALSVVLVLEAIPEVLNEAKNMYIWRKLDTLPTMVKSAIQAKTQAGNDEVLVALQAVQLF